MTLRDCEQALGAIRDLSQAKHVDVHTNLAAIHAVSGVAAQCLRDARERRTAERDALITERDELRAALVKIANAESGTWGQIAHDALRAAAA